MLFEIQRACPRPGQSRVIASGSSALKTLERLTTLLPNAKVSVLAPPPETKKDEFVSMPDLRGPVSEIEPDEDEDDITLAELKEQLEDNMTLAELQDKLLAEEEENYENYENYNKKVKEETTPIKWVDEMTYYSRTCGELQNF